MPAIKIEESIGTNSTSRSNILNSSISSTLISNQPSTITSTAENLYSSSSYNFSELPSFSPPSVRNLLAIGPQNVYDEFRTADPLDFFNENFDDDIFGSPLPFDASENGLWNGRFVPPPPRPPFMDEILTDGVTTCDLCSWAMPTKSTFIFEGTIEKASELGWPLTLIIVSIISAILGAIIMVTVVKCRRKKSTNRNETHVQWWSRNKRPSNNLRRSNIYTAHPAGDSIRGLHPNNNTNTIASSTATAPSTNESCSWPNVTTIVVTS